MQGKVSQMDEHILYPVLNLPRMRWFLNHPQSKPADGEFTELLSPFILENKGRPWQTTTWKWLCPKDSRIFELLVATFSIFTDELAMACQRASLEAWNSLSVSWNLKRSRKLIHFSFTLGMNCFLHCVKLLSKSELLKTKILLQRFFPAYRGWAVAVQQRLVSHVLCYSGRSMKWKVSFNDTLWTGCKSDYMFE